jgi:neuropeptide Y receptor
MKAIPDCPNNTHDLARVRSNALTFVSSQGGMHATAMAAIVSAYVVLILFGAFGNALVCYVVARQPAMRQPLNVLIANLALSDLILCVITQTFNVIKFSRLQWHFGNVMCKLVPLLAGANVFVSTMTISAIALNRFVMIVYPMRGRLATVRVAYVTIGAVWLVSLALASPLSTLTNVVAFEPCRGMILFEVCVETNVMRGVRLTYSVASALFQYLIPMAIIVATNSVICWKLGRRMRTRSTANCSRQSPASGGTLLTQASSFAPVDATARAAAEQYRQRKTGILLFAVAGAFAACWLPLNVFNVLADMNETLMLNVLSKSKLVFPVCHLLVLLSACINPVLYGWLNTNFRHEFSAMLCRFRQHEGRGQGYSSKTHYSQGQVYRKSQMLCHDSQNPKHSRPNQNQTTMGEGQSLGCLTGTDGEVTNTVASPANKSQHLSPLLNGRSAVTCSQRIATIGGDMTASDYQTERGTNV